MRTILLVLLTAMAAAPLNAFTCQLQEVLDGSSKHVSKTVLVQMYGFWGSETHKVQSISFPTKVTSFCYEFSGDWRCGKKSPNSFGVAQYSSSVMYKNENNFIILERDVWIDTRNNSEGQASYINNIDERGGRYSCSY
jgi:hypothetical protein